MRNALLALLGMMSISAYSWTEAETNMVGLALAEATAYASGCDGGPLPPGDPMANEPLDEPFPTFGSLFEASLPCAQDWTPEAKRAAFFHYLGMLPTSVTNGVFGGDEWYASSAIGFCRVKGDVAVLMPAMGVLAATNMPGCCQWEAAGIVEKWAQATEAMNSCLDGALSREGCLNHAPARRRVYDAYSNKLDWRTMPDRPISPGMALPHFIMAFLIMLAHVRLMPCCCGCFLDMPQVQIVCTWRLLRWLRIQARNGRADISPTSQICS